MAVHLVAAFRTPGARLPQPAARWQVRHIEEQVQQHTAKVTRLLRKETDMQKQYSKAMKRRGKRALEPDEVRPSSRPCPALAVRISVVFGGFRYIFGASRPQSDTTANHPGRSECVQTSTLRNGSDGAFGKSVQANPSCDIAIHRLQLIIFFCDLRYRNCELRYSPLQSYEFGGAFPYSPL